MKRTKNNTSYDREEVVKKRTVFKKEMSKFSGNSEDTVTMRTVDEFETHGGGSVNGIHISTRWIKSTMAMKRIKLKIASTSVTIYCITKRRVTTTIHSVNVINDRLARMSDIYKFFIMFIKYIL